MPRDGPMQGLVSLRPGMESIVPGVPAPMVAEPQIVTVLRAGCRVCPNAAIAAVKFHHGKIGACWSYSAERQTLSAKANRFIVGSVF
jgi:hypothetical protein